VSLPPVGTSQLQPASVPVPGVQFTFSPSDGGAVVDDEQAINVSNVVTTAPTSPHAERGARPAATISDWNIERRYSGSGCAREPTPPYKCPTASYPSATNLVTEGYAAVRADYGAVVASYGT
jgi:hypothetical protein